MGFLETARACNRRKRAKSSGKLSRKGGHRELSSYLLKVQGENEKIKACGSRQRFHKTKKLRGKKGSHRGKPYKRRETGPGLIKGGKAGKFRAAGGTPARLD